jgi:hypothetical protein
MPISGHDASTQDMAIETWAHAARSRRAAWRGCDVGFPMGTRRASSAQASLAEDRRSHRHHAVATCRLRETRRGQPMTSVREVGNQLLAVPQLGCAVLDEYGRHHEFLDRHYDRQLGDHFVAANAATVDADIAVTGTLALDDAIYEELRRPEEIGHSHSQRHVCSCPSQRISKNYACCRTTCQLQKSHSRHMRANISASLCFVLGTENVSENRLRANPYCYGVAA